LLPLALLTGCAGCSNRSRDAGRERPRTPPADDRRFHTGDPTGRPPGEPLGGAVPGRTQPAPPPGGDYREKVTVRLTRIAPGGRIVSFGVPVPPGVVGDAASVQARAAGRPIAGAAVRVLLRDHDRTGAPRGVRALQVQIPAAAVTGDPFDVDVVWRGAAAPAPRPGVATGALTASAAPAAVPFESPDVSGPSAEVVATAVRSIQATGGVPRLVEGPVERRTLFSGREPRVLAHFPTGYLAATRLLGELVPAAQTARPETAGLAFFSRAVTDFGLSSMYHTRYPVHPASLPDPKTGFEGWLYDRCATFLSFYAHTSDLRFLRHALRSCSYYAGQIALEGDDKAPPGIFKGKSEPDIKYSHLRGLYAYYALTGDDGALRAGRTIAALWEREPTFVLPYRAGRLRAPDKLWTERLLGASLEGLIYGHRLTDDPKYLAAARELVTTAHRHVTGDAATLAALNPGVGPFPPQNCFIHSALQHAEGNADEPWCSGWMAELAVDALLRYQELTGDDRVDEIFIRLTRFLRDVGSQYMRHGKVLDDRFLAPKACYDPRDGERVRILVPLYGAALRADGTRENAGEYDDFEHCADATALTAAGLRALKRRGLYDANPVRPFPSEGASFLALHHELAHCAQVSFQDAARVQRAPESWTARRLADGLANPVKFIDDNKIGFPTHSTGPARKISWQFNTSLLQFGLLADARIAVSALTPGAVQAPGCAPVSRAAPRLELAPETRPIGRRARADQGGPSAPGPLPFLWSPPDALLR
jgi:hypothetical protein